MNVKNGNSLNMKLWTIKGERCLAYFYFAWRQQRVVKSFKARKMLQSNLTHQCGIGGAQKNYRRRRADHHKSAAVAPTNCQRPRGAGGAGVYNVGGQRER